MGGPSDYFPNATPGQVEALQRLADQWHAREEEEERAREEEWARAAHDILTTWLLASHALTHYAVSIIEGTF